MKKFLCFLLSAVMLLGLCACAGNGGESQEEAEPTFAMGTASGNTYRNDFLQMGCTLPEGWVFYSDEEILQLNNIAGERVDAEVWAQIESANIVYDMFAQNQADNSNISVNMEKLTEAQLKSLNIQQSLESQIPAIKTSYESLGYTNISVGYEKITVDGKTLDALRLTAEIQGIPFYSEIFCFRRGSYLANVSLCALQEDNRETYRGYFTLD